MSSSLTYETQPTGWLSPWTRFWFMPRSLLSLHALRIAFGLFSIVWLLSFVGHVHEFFSYEGWIDRTALTSPGSVVDPFNWSLLNMLPENPGLLSSVYWVSVAILVAFTLGLFTRITAVLAWLVVVSFTGNQFIEIDTDIFLRMAMFYLMIGYLLADFSAVLGSSKHWLWKCFHHTDSTSSAAMVAIRLMQLHFALAFVVMGLQKLQHMEWWAGVSFWYPMHRTSTLSVEAINELRTYAPSYLNFISFAAYAVLVWQIFFPTFAWRTGWPRWVLLGGAVSGMIGLMIIYPIPLLGPVFFLLCLVYLTDAEWKTVLSPLQRLVNGGA